MISKKVGTNTHVTKYKQEPKHASKVTKKAENSKQMNLDSSG